MNIEDLTLKDIFKLKTLFNNEETKQSSILDDAIGRYAIVRSRNEGVNCGKVLQADETGIVLEDARRLYYHKPKDSNTSWYEGISQSGLSSDSKISGTTLKKYIIEDYSITLCTETAEKSLRSHEATKS